MVCCKALTFIGGRVSQLLLDQLIKMRIQTCGCSSNLCPQLDWCQVEIQPGCFRRHVSGKQGDILKGDASRFECALRRIRTAGTVENEQAVRREAYAGFGDAERDGCQRC